MGDDEEVARALEQLYRDKYQRFFRLALAVTGAREPAADAVQEGFVRALRARASLRDRARLESWVWRTVLNVARDQRATHARNGAVESAPEVAERDSLREEWRELRVAVAALPERQREVLFLRHYADLDYARIAEVLGIARGTVAATLTQAHAALRKTIAVPR
jgi:RNA polymerase sigma-70 factor, ECF subfamily